MKKLPEPEVRFKDNAEELSLFILDHVQKLYNQGYQNFNPGLIFIASEILKGIDDRELIEGFITNSHPYWDKIKNREESFFIDHASDVFVKLPSSSIDLFKDLYQTKDKEGKYLISDKTKVTLWQFFDSFVKISIRYVHKNQTIDIIDFDKHAEKWQIKL